MKYLNICLILLILFSGSLSLNDVKADAAVKEILNIERGREAGKIDYDLRYWGDKDKTLIRTGVESFVVDEEERIYLSNYATGSIKVYHENRLEGEIDISRFFQPRDIEIFSGSLYIYEDNGRVSRLSLDNEEKRAEYAIPAFLPYEVIDLSWIRDIDGLEISPVPEERSMPIRFVSDHGKKELAIVYDNNSLYRPEDGRISFLDLNDFQYLEALYKQLIGFDENNNIYILGIDVFDSRDTIEIKELVYRFDSSGKLTGIAEPLDERNYIVPYKYLYLNGRGNLYQLLVLKDRVKVYRLAFQDVAGHGKGESGKPRPVLESRGNSGNNTAFAEMREILYRRAVELAEYRWTYKPAHHGVKFADTDLPYYLKILDREMELKGIPYCWGGFDSLDTGSINQKWANFPDAVEKKVMTGNVGLTDYYFPGTAGLDCSGFISAVLRLESRKASWYFYDHLGLVKRKGFSELSLMDVVAKNGHLLFFLNKNDYGINSIETNMLGSEWKVKYFHWSWRTLRDNAYKARDYRNIAEIPAVLKH